MPAYRADIDGLRALAVLPVVLFHAGVAGFDGGFVGVDVFFVVSGYLITSIIAGEIGSGTFKLARFYERRVRRIFPALFLVVAACVPLALVILVPEHLEDFGQSVIATALFGSNFFFYLEDGYFEGPADLHPLLHTWSLAVEEQFYLVFPLLLLMLSRRNINPKRVLIGLALLSFGYSVWRVGSDSIAAFYLLPSRFWELLMGGVLAIYAGRLRPSMLPAAASTMVGLVLIGIGVFGFNPGTPFPGPAALLPCLGAALVIFGGTTSNPANRLLGTELLRGCGLLSYSLYLWHFPLIVFSRHLIVRPFTPPEAVALIAASFLLAWLTWRYVEQPFRARPYRVQRGTILRTATVAVVGSIAVGLYTDFSDGAPGRMNAQAKHYLAATKDKDTACMRKGTGCLLGPAEAAPRFLVWGDSHASAMLPAFRSLADEYAVAGVAALRGGCLPLLGYRVLQVIAESCAAHVRSTFESLDGSQISTVFLAARWTMVVEESMYGYESGTPLELVSDPDPGKYDSNAAVLRDALQLTLKALGASGRAVVIVGPVPEVGWHVPHTLAQRSRFGAMLDAAAIRPTLAQVQARNQRTIEILASAARAHGATLLLPQGAFCTAAEGCAVVDDGRPLYFDTDHLTITGAQRLTELFREAVRQVVPPASPPAG